MLPSAHAAFVGMAGQQLGSQHRKEEASDPYLQLLRTYAGDADAR